ncbi:MAG: neprosin family prolyl endopeptidase [Polyangiaceae bacterium]
MRNSRIQSDRSKARNALLGTVIVGLLSAFVLSGHKNEPAAQPKQPAAPEEHELEPVLEQARVPASTAASTLAARPAPSAENELDRIQRYIDSLYTPADVVSSFEAAPGEEVDCIHFDAQPSVRRAIALGHRIRPEDYKSTRLSQTPMSLPSASAFDGRPDPEGRPRACLGDTVPMMRTTVEQIQRAGGLDVYLRHGGRKAAPPPPQGGPIPQDDPSYMHVTAQYDSSNLGTIWGGQSIASVYAPSVGTRASATAQPHSLAQTWTTSGTQFYPCEGGVATGVACTSTDQAGQCFQTIEVGWTVDPFSSNGGDNNPHLFTFSTQDGYWATGCYDTQPCATEACIFNAGDQLPTSSVPPCNQYGGQVPNPIILFMNTPFMPGMPLTSDVSTLGATPHELQFTTVWDDFVGWVIYINGQAMAAFELGTWTGSFYDLPNGTSPITTTPGAPLQTTKATIFMAGGEITSGNQEALNLSPNPTVVEMGSGIGAVEGFKAAAYHRDIGVALNDGAGPGLINSGMAYPPFSNPPFATDMNCYSLGFGLANGGPQTVSLTTQSLGYTFLEYPSSNPTTSFKSPAPGGTNWENYLYYGGFGNFSGVPFSMTDPKGGTFDFCCSTAQQNGVNNDSQCPNSQLANICP